MITQDIIPVTKFRKNIFKIIKETQLSGKIYGITEKGELKVYLISPSELESLIETAQIKQEFPTLKRDIGDVKKAIKTESYKKWPTLNLSSDKKAKYGLSNYAQTKRRKRIKKT